MNMRLRDNDDDDDGDGHLKSSRLFEYDQVWHLLYTAITAMIMCSICSAAPFFLPIGYESNEVCVQIQPSGYDQRHYLHSLLAWIARSICSCFLWAHTQTYVYKYIHTYIKTYAKITGIRSLSPLFYNTYKRMYKYIYM